MRLIMLLVCVAPPALGGCATVGVAAGATVGAVRGVVGVATDVVGGAADGTFFSPETEVAP